MTERLELLPRLDRRLGRHVRHDERNKNYRVMRAVLLPELVDTHHDRRGRALNQGQLGGCTFFSLCHALKCEPLWRTPTRHPFVPVLNSKLAVKGYSRATQIDPFAGQYPPDDTGSSGQAACQAAVEMGLIGSYEWAFGGAEARAALLVQPTMHGTVWTEAMFHPDSDGRVHPTGAVMGGHEYAAIGLDVERRRTWYWQTWGWWGLDGRGLFYQTWEDEDALLAQSGDVVVPRL